MPLLQKLQQIRLLKYLRRSRQRELKLILLFLKLHYDCWDIGTLQVRRQLLGVQLEALHAGLLSLKVLQ